MPKEISEAQRLSRYSSSGAVRSVNSSVSGLKVWLSAGLAPTAVEAWTGEGDIAEHSAKGNRVLSFAAQVTAAGRTAAMPADEGRGLGGEDMLLQTLLQRFAFADRQTNGFQLVVALHEMQNLAVGEHGAIVADGPKLKVNVHGRRHTGVFRKLQGNTAAKLPAFTCPSYNLPRFLVLS
jgi:hypothetical protein